MENKKAVRNIYNYASGGNFYHFEAVTIETAIGVLVDCKGKLQPCLADPLSANKYLRGTHDQVNIGEKAVRPSSSTDNHQIQAEQGIPEDSSLNATSSHQCQTGHVALEINLEETKTKIQE